MNELDVIAKKISKCKKCPLYKDRINTVPGTGNQDAQLIIIGEAPGAKEDKQGIPFIGSAGKILEAALESINLKRSDVFITNTVKCRPPKNRDPKQEEIKACSRYLEDQMKVLKPKIFLILGNIALKRIFGKDKNITEEHGKLIEKDAKKYFITFHPAATIYNQKLKPELIKDFKKLKRHLNKINKDN